MDISYTLYRRVSSGLTSRRAAGYYNHVETVYHWAEVSQGHETEEDAEESIPEREDQFSGEVFKIEKEYRS